MAELRLYDLLAATHMMAEQGQKKWPSGALDVTSDPAGLSHYQRHRQVPTNGFGSCGAASATWPTEPPSPAMATDAQTRDGCSSRHGMRLPTWSPRGEQQRPER